MPTVRDDVNRHGFFVGMNQPTHILSNFNFNSGLRRTFLRAQGDSFTPIYTMQTTNHCTLNTAICHELSDNRTDNPGSEYGDPLPPHVPEVLPSLLFPPASCRAWNRLGRQSLSLLTNFRVIVTNAEADEALGRGDTPSGTCFPVFLNICFQARCGQLMLVGRVPATRCPDTRRSLCASVRKPPAALTCKEPDTTHQTTMTYTTILREHPFRHGFRHLRRKTDGNGSRLNY